MSTEDNNSLKSLISKLGLRVGKSIIDDSSEASITSALLYADSAGNLAKTTVSVSKPVYIDSSSVPQTGNLPFALPLAAGATDTSFSSLAITGSATGSANELMHLNLVAGANATSTIAGFYRVTVTDNAGVITNGAYYAPFYTLN